MDNRQIQGKINFFLVFLFLIIIGVIVVVATLLGPLKVWMGALYGSVRITATVAERQKTVVFKPAEGGITTMETSDGQMLAFSFPDNFTNTTADINLRASVYSNTFFDDDKPAPVGKTFVGKTYEFDLFNASSGAQMFRVVKPIIITIPYTQADIAGVDEQTLAPYRRETEDSEWQLIPGAVIDTITHTITFSTRQFSSFVLLATPVPTQTVVTSASSSGGGGGRGVFSYINSVIGKIAQKEPQVVVPMTALPATTTNQTASPSIFTKTLSVGVKNPEVLLLQKYLNTHGFLVAAKGPGSLGFETDTFGALTRRSLVKFQEAHTAEILAPNLKKGTGIVGPKTRGYINSHP